MTGGHVTPALAIIDELNSHEIVFVGRKYALEHEQTLSLEYKEILKRNIKFINLTTGRLNRSVSLHGIMSVFRIPLGFIQGFQIITKERPNALLSFGGYLAVPVAFWAWFFQIPVYTHEQTIEPGLANRVLAFFAKKIFSSFEETRAYFPERKTILTGNPVRKSVLKVQKKTFDVPENVSTIYVTGGSLGSHSINKHIKTILHELLKSFVVIHQTGDTKEYKDFEELLAFRKKFSKTLQERYILKKHFFADEIGYVYNISDFVIGRSGANTFFELLTLEKPAIFIPLPWSGKKEQQKHAEIFKTYNVGEIFQQSEPSEKLLQLIKKVSNNLKTYKKNFRQLKYLYKEDATSIIIKEITQK